MTKKELMIWIKITLYILVGALVLYGFIRLRTDAVKIAELEQYASSATTERDNALWLMADYKQKYEKALGALKELSEQKIVPQETVVLEEPDPECYADEFGWDFDYVVRVVGAEARGEPFEGILAVCQCIANTARRTGMTPEQVVKSGQYTDPIGHEVLDGMESVNEACLMVFSEKLSYFLEPIEYFYSTKNGGYSNWHEQCLMFCFEIGNHRFFKLCE